ncbi:MAG: DUF378 domain-containing protein [Clostridia bacterium]|nr:DUF378 domain-containing protein [Clostridia bacterium]
MKITSIIAFILVIVGALNWLLIGLFDFNLVSMIFGSLSFVSRTIYTLVGIASLWMIFFIFAYRPFRNVHD